MVFRFGIPFISEPFPHFHCRVSGIKTIRRKFNLWHSSRQLAQESTQATCALEGHASPHSSAPTDHIATRAGLRPNWA